MTQYDRDMRLAEVNQRIKAAAKIMQEHTGVGGSDARRIRQEANATLQALAREKQAIMNGTTPDPTPAPEINLKAPTPRPATQMTAEEIKVAETHLQRAIRVRNSMDPGPNRTRMDDYIRRLREGEPDAVFTALLHKKA